MSGKNIYIKDTCILIDLIELDLIESFYDLKLQIVTTVQVVSEITDDTQQVILKDLISKNIIKIDNKGKFETINDLFKGCAGLSFADCSVIELALRNSGFILSSDGKLRKYAVQKQITVNGILWIIEELVNTNLITVENALYKLGEYPKVNARAPLKEISAIEKKFKEFSVINS